MAALPYILMAGCAAVAGAGAWGWHAGTVSTTNKYEAQKSAAAADAANATADAIKHAADVSLSIVSVAGEYLARIAESRVTTRVIVEKVKADALQNVPADCVVPGVTYKLRRQQVDESAGIAAGHRPVQR